MKKPAERLLILVLVTGALVAAPVGLSFLQSWYQGLSAGEWEDDPKNWRRAFEEEPPAEVQVMRSKYWRADRLIVQFAYYFEVQAAPGWRAAFFKKHGLEQVPPEEVVDYLAEEDFEIAPRWFVAGSNGEYDMWINPEEELQAWVRKTDGRLFLEKTYL